MTPTARDRREVRRGILDVAESDGVTTRAGIVQSAASVSECSKQVVREELDRLEREGEIYLVGSGEAAEVRRT